MSQHKYGVHDLKINDIFDAVMERSITSKELTEFIAEQWKNCSFFLKYDDINSLKTRIDAEARGVSCSFHGRINQAISSSRHIYGSHDTVSARLVFDPPVENPKLEEIEPHTHPVASIILVIHGSGEFFLVFNEKKNKHFIRMVLLPGAVVCFPASVVHAMKPGNQGICTLNVTDRQNQPPCRENYPFSADTNSFQLLSNSNFSRVAYISDNLETENYCDFIKSNTSKG